MSIKVGDIIVNKKNIDDTKKKILELAFGKKKDIPKYVDIKSNNTFLYYFIFIFIFIIVIIIILLYGKNSGFNLLS